MQRLINDEWKDCIESDLYVGEFYRVKVNGGYVGTQYRPQSKDDNEREWRDIELSNSDWIVQISDHPKHSDYITYRQELRDYPSQPDFPNGTRPTL